MIRKRIAELLARSIERCKSEGLLPADIEIEPAVEMPREKGHGDYAAPIAFLLAKKARKNPEAIARCLVERMDAGDLCTAVEVAAKGFINFHVADRVFRQELADILRLGLDPFFSDIGAQNKVILEFVSANPTGPLHIGHGRGAAVGDVLANILSRSGYQVSREYYVNDAGRQIETLGRSVYLRWKELQGEKVEYPKDLYQGNYVRDIAAMLLPDAAGVPAGEDEAVAFMARFAADLVASGIKRDLESFGVFFDNYYRESGLFESGAVEATIEELKVRGWLKDEEGALWFKTSELGDEKDRVLIKSGGEKTYFASDMAYHRDKFEPRLRYGDRHMGVGPSRLHRADEGIAGGARHQQGPSQGDPHPVRDAPERRQAHRDVHEGRPVHDASGSARRGGQGRGQVLLPYAEKRRPPGIRPGPRQKDVQ